MIECGLVPDGGIKIKNETAEEEISTRFKNNYRRINRLLDAKAALYALIAMMSAFLSFGLSKQQKPDGAQESGHHRCDH